MDNINLYFNLLSNIFTSITFILVVNFFGHIKSNKLYKMYSILYFIFNLLYTIIPHFPFSFGIVLSIDIIFTFFSLSDVWQKKILIVLLSNIYFYGCYAFFYITHLILFDDIKLQIHNKMFFQFTSLSGIEFAYIILSLFICNKRIKKLPSTKNYRIHFNLITYISILCLILSTFLLNSNFFTNDTLVTILFTITTIIITLSLTEFRKITDIMEENTLNRIQLEKVKMESDYMNHINDSLNVIQSLRHDMKNHLTIIEGYTRENQSDKVLAYISKISKNLDQTTVINTPSILVSSILNAKQAICQKKHINLETCIYFSELYIDDYLLLIILGNLLDNAITAASKLEHGAINLKIEQVDSHLLIFCENNHKEIIRTKDGSFLSSKIADSTPHGLGITNIKNAVAQLNGTTNIEYTEQSFRFNILLPNYKK